MSEQMHPTLRVGEVIPAFSLPGGDGMPHGPWDYKQRNNLLLLFLPAVLDKTAESYLQELANNYACFREEICAVLVVTAAPVFQNLELQERLHLPFPVVADPQGRVFGKYAFALEQSAVVLANRYNALYAFWSENELPPISELLASLDYMNSLCTP